MYDESIEHLVRYLSIREREDLAAQVRATYTKSGYHDTIRSLIQWSADQAIPMINPAVLYVMVGEKKQAIAAINRLLDSQSFDSLVIRVNTLPIFEPLRDQPGYAEILKRMNLID